ncbi:energy-coupling factor ABC transporter ATP-binding protein [Stappia indica]|uniref:Biotin transport system ATP-binding protein n=1 Tax=Stappia indica TaxID=538381 RepID=A0A285TIX9_9HYPH|nr:ABC transporter ATP-binding protein [Stappia indica]SOC22078.1 biotin transport system ATP-binding protein [Stappia indica]
MSVSQTQFASIDSVTLQRGAVSVFQGLSLELSERRIALVGLNGSGKSSLLRMLNGLLLPDEGTVTVFGLDTRKSRRKLPRHVGMVFQNPDHQMIFPTVLEELAFGPRQMGATRADAEALARRTLVQHGCDGWAERPVALLSEGQKQLVCLLGASISEPGLLLCDEPFSGLDLSLRLHFAAHIAEIPAHVVMVSHDLDMLCEFDRVIWLEKGAIVGDGHPDVILPEYRAFATTRAGQLTAGGL